MNGKRMSRFSVRWRTHGRSGSAAIEFAFIAPVFFMILFGIIEGGVMFFGQAALINAVQDTARLIRTGQAQGSAMPQSGFAQQVCNGIQPLLDCANLTVDVESYPGGFGAVPPPALGAGGTPPSNYSPGNPCDVVVVRAFYKYTVLTPIVAPLLTGGRDFNYLTAAAAFRNEPFTSAVSGC